MVIAILAIFVKISENHTHGGFAKIIEFALVIIFVNSLKNDNFCFKMKFSKFLGIQPTYNDFGKKGWIWAVEIGLGKIE